MSLRQTNYVLQNPKGDLLFQSRRDIIFQSSVTDIEGNITHTPNLTIKRDRIVIDRPIDISNAAVFNQSVDASNITCRALEVSDNPREYYMRDQSPYLAMLGSSGESSMIVTSHIDDQHAFSGTSITSKYTTSAETISKVSATTPKDDDVSMVLNSSVNPIQQTTLKSQTDSVYTLPKPPLNYVHVSSAISKDSYVFRLFINHSTNRLFFDIFDPYRNDCGPMTIIPLYQDQNVDISNAQVYCSPRNYFFVFWFNTYGVYYATYSKHGDLTLSPKGFYEAPYEIMDYRISNIDSNDDTYGTFFTKNQVLIWKIHLAPSLLLDLEQQHSILTHSGFNLSSAFIKTAMNQLVPEHFGLKHILLYAEVCKHESQATAKIMFVIKHQNCVMNIGLYQETAFIAARYLVYGYEYYHNIGEINLWKENDVWFSVGVDIDVENRCVIFYLLDETMTEIAKIDIYSVHDLEVTAGLRSVDDNLLPTILNQNIVVDTSLSMNHIICCYADSADYLLKLANAHDKRYVILEPVFIWWSLNLDSIDEVHHQYNQGTLTISNRMSIFDGAISNLELIGNSTYSNSHIINEDVCGNYAVDSLTNVSAYLDTSGRLVVYDGTTLQERYNIPIDFSQWSWNTPNIVSNAIVLTGKNSSSSMYKMVAIILDASDVRHASYEWISTNDIAHISLVVQGNILSAIWEEYDLQSTYHRIRCSRFDFGPITTDVRQEWILSSIHRNKRHPCGTKNGLMAFLADTDGPYHVYVTRLHKSAYMFPWVKASKSTSLPHVSAPRILCVSDTRLIVAYMTSNRTNIAYTLFDISGNQPIPMDEALVGNLFPVVSYGDVNENIEWFDVAYDSALPAILLSWTMCNPITNTYRNYAQRFIYNAITKEFKAYTDWSRMLLVENTGPIHEKMASSVLGKTYFYYTVNGVNKLVNVEQGTPSIFYPRTPYNALYPISFSNSLKTRNTFRVDTKLITRRQITVSFWLFINKTMHNDSYILRFGDLFYIYVAPMRIHVENRDWIDASMMIDWYNGRWNHIVLVIDLLTAFPRLKIYVNGYGPMFETPMKIQKRWDGTFSTDNCTVKSVYITDQAPEIQRWFNRGLPYIHEQEHDGLGWFRMDRLETGPNISNDEPTMLALQTRVLEKLLPLQPHLVAIYESEIIPVDVSSGVIDFNGFSLSINPLYDRIIQVYATKRWVYIVTYSFMDHWYDLRIYTHKLEIFLQMTNVAEERVYDVPLTPLHAFHLPLTPLLKIDSRKAIVLDDTGTRKVAIIDISGELVGCTMYNVVVGQQVLLLENKITRLVSSMGVYSDRMDSTVLSVNTKNGHMGVNNGCPNVALDIQGDTKISGTFALGANDDLKIKSLSNQGVSISSQKLMLDSYVEVVGGLKVPLVDTRYASFGLDGMVVYNPYKRQYEGFIDNRWTQLGQRYPETFMINVTDETTVVNADTVNPIYTFLPPGNIRVLRTRIHVRDFGDGPTSIMIRTRSFETMINVATVINTYGIVNSFQKWEVNEQDLVSIYIISTAGKTKGVKITFWYVHIFDEDEYKYIL